MSLQDPGLVVRLRPGTKSHLSVLERNSQKIRTACGQVRFLWELEPEEVEVMGGQPSCGVCARLLDQRQLTPAVAG